MSEKKTIRFHIGDYVVCQNGIGRIEDMIIDDRKPEFLIDYLVLAKGQDWSYRNGVIGTHLWISPLEASKVFSPATAEDFAKAKKFVDLCDESFRSILSKYSKDSVTS